MLMSWMSHWANGVIVAVILATIFEMILPEGNNKKYIKTVIGVFVLFTMLSPLISKIQQTNFDWNSLAKQYAWNNTEESSKEVSACNLTAEIQNVYQNNLEQDIQNRIQEMGYEASSIKIAISPKEDGKIQSVIIAKIRKKEESHTYQMKKVETVQIHPNEPKEDSDENDISDTEKQEVIKNLAQYYGIPEKNVKIQ